MSNKLSTILFFIFAGLSLLTVFSGFTIAILGIQQTLITAEGLKIIALSFMILMAIFGIIMVRTTR